MKQNSLKCWQKAKRSVFPRVLGIGNSKDTSFLLLEFLPVQPFTPHSAYCFGQQLAKLHQWEEQPRYGFDFDTHIDTTPPNKWLGALELLLFGKAYRYPVATRFRERDGFAI